jgi:hypothetical protein
MHQCIRVLVNRTLKGIECFRLRRSRLTMIEETIDLADCADSEDCLKTWWVYSKFARLSQQNRKAKSLQSLHLAIW